MTALSEKGKIEGPNGCILAVIVLALVGAGAIASLIGSALTAAFRALS